jgi:2-polyprenyl-3-methyl-5-hydroxy-6-metoxy-1,4-benzoquinol methylase
MKKIILNFLRTKLASKILLKSALILHGMLYDLISILVVSKHDGVHPKHEIIKYEDWFYNCISSNDVILDIGCNEGNLTKYLAEKAKKAYGIEIVEKHLKKAASKSKDNLQFFQADATNFDYSMLEPISVIVLSNVLEHIQNRVDFLKEIVKSVKWKSTPRLLIRVPTIEREWLPVYKKNEGLKYTLDNTHFVEHTIQEFYDEMRLSNLEIISLYVKFGEIYAECAPSKGKS